MSNYLLIDLFNKVIDKNNIRDYIEDDTIKAVEDNIKIFENIPKENIENVFENLLEKLFEFDTQKREIEFDTQKRETIKPVTQIKQDIKTIQNYQDMIIRLYGAKNKINGSFSLFNAPTEIKEIYNNNIAILKDLQDKSFKIISKLKYYQSEPITKNDIKEFLNEIVTQYKLKNITLDKKQLIDRI